MVVEVFVGAGEGLEDVLARKEGVALAELEDVEINRAQAGGGAGAVVVVATVHQGKAAP